MTTLTIAQPRTVSAFIDGIRARFATPAEAGPAVEPVQGSHVAAARAGYVTGEAGRMLAVIRHINRRSGLVTRIALGTSIFHQIGYLLDKAWAHTDWSAPSRIMSSVTMVLLAFAVPAACDLIILNCVDTIGAQAAGVGDKVRALIVLIAPAGVSGTVNFLGDGPMVIKLLAAFLVCLIPLGEALRFVRPDWDKMERTEAKIAAPAPAPVKRSSKGRKCSHGCKCGRHPKVTPVDAPVSPAPNGQLVAGLWVPNRR